MFSSLYIWWKNILIGTSSLSHIYLVQFNNDLSINFTKSYKVINYLNEDLLNGHSYYKYFNNTIYLSYHRTYYQTYTPKRYVAFFLKTNSYFDLDFWDTNVVEPLQSEEVRKIIFYVYYTYNNMPLNFIMLLIKYI